MSPQRQRQVLFALLAVFGLVVGWRLLGPLMSGGDAKSISAAEVAERSASVDADVEVLRTADLDLEPAEFRVGRDPFRFVTVQKKPPPKPQAKPAPPPRRKPRPPANNAANQRAAAQPPPVDLVYLGKFGPQRRPIAVFSDGSDIFNVFEGGVVKGHFLVDKIGYESADLKFVNFPDAPAQRLAIGG